MGQDDGRVAAAQAPFVFGKYASRARRILFGGSDPNAHREDEDDADIWSFEETSRLIQTDLAKRLKTRKRQHLDAVKTFLPRILQRQEINANSSVVMHRGDGCVVFSDASGFTKLTETLAQKADGAEVLSKCLNKFFTPLIDIIESYRGDVIKFSGDALSILFEATDDYRLSEFPCGSPDALRKTPLQLACLRGAACCIEIHKRLHNFDTGEGGVRLTLHIGVGAGRITILQVGGENNRFEYVIAGTPMEQIAIAEPLAGSGETVLSPQCWEEVKFTVVEGAPLEGAPDGYHRMVGLVTQQHTYPTVKQAALHCSRVELMAAKLLSETVLLDISERFIPRGVLKHLKSGNSSSINEMRSVTIIFAQIGGVDVSTEYGSRVAQQLMTGMQQACYTYEGNLNKFLVDDKGLLFLFVFGLPPLMHIDDPSRAIMACWDMGSVLKSMGLAGRFGVTTGRVFCGIVGSDVRREYTVMGDTVNLSARLMAKAEENSVLIDEATHLRSQQDVTCRKVEPFMVKGKAKLIQAYEPHEPRVHFLEVAQLGVLLNQRDWGLGNTELDVKVSVPKASGKVDFKVKMPWIARSKLMGGSSPLLQMTRWRELQQLQSLIDGQAAILKVGGSLSLFGQSGSGKTELCEYLVTRAQEAGLCPLFGIMRSRPAERWRAVATLMQTCLSVQCHDPGKNPKPIDEAVEEALQKLVHGNKRLHKVLAFFGFEGFEVPGERNSADDVGLPDFELDECAAEILAKLVQEVAKKQPLLLVLRLRRGTDLLDSTRGRGSGAFWALSRRLADLAVGRQREIMAGRKGVHPILLVTMARDRPPHFHAGASSTSIASVLLEAVDQPLPNQPGARELVVKPLTEDAAVELMCYCLGVPTTHGGSLVKRKLREFVSAVSINIPTYIQECLQHLTQEQAVEVKNGECTINVTDLNTVNIAEWVQTSMVGGTISQLESLKSAQNHIMKLATVFDGPFSTLDLAAANRVLFGRLPRMLAFHDQSKLLCSCCSLVEQGFLQPVLNVQTLPADGAPMRLPRWTISNSLFRKVAGCMLLNSQRILIKRAVLIERALNVEIPKRIQPGAKPAPTSRSVTKGTETTEMKVRFSASVTVPFMPNKASGDAAEGMNVLYTACALGNLHMVGEILKSSLVDVNKPNDLAGYTPLHFAASSGEAEVVHLLCEQAAEVNARSLQGETPVLVAAQRGCLDVVQYLCETQNALDTSDKDAYDFWEQALPEIFTEDDIALPLSPSFVGPVPGDPEKAAKDREKILSFLLDRLQACDRDSVGTGCAATWRSSGTSNAEENMKVDKSGSEMEIVRVRVRNSQCSGNSHEHRPSGTPSKISVNELSARDSSRRASESTASSPMDHLQSPLPDRRTNLYHRRIRGRSLSSFAANLMPESFRNAALRGRIRTWLRGRVALVVMLVALVVALYLPDLWVTIGLPSSLGADIILFLVMFLFLSELILLSLVDTSYPFSFFFFMDCIGTISMIWDISWFLGVPATQEQQNTTGERDLTLFRATRTAKIGARAGRLSRLVKVMRFLPGMGHRGNSTPASEAEKLQQISNQLTNVLSKRVACLTIILVVVMPLFTIGSYPEGDFSKQVWIESLSRRLTDLQELQATTPDCSAASENACGSATRAFWGSVDEFAGFYVDKAYGPYKICVSDLAPLLGCHDLSSRSGFSEPARKSFHMVVIAGGIQSTFDWSSPTRAEANMGLILISVVILLMCGACTLLNYSASELAVRPLERMLTSIKNSAKAIFSSVNSMAAADADDEDFGEDMDGEVALLERVVKKIATLAELSSKKNLFDEERMKGMKTEELGVLALTAVRAGKPSTSSADLGGGEIPGATGGTEISVTMRWQLDEIGLAYETLNSWSFHVLDLTSKQQEQIAAWLLMNNPGSCNYMENNVDMQTLRAFIGLISSGYMDNHFHNFMHAVDVTHTSFRYMAAIQAERIFSMLDQFALLVAAVGHDLGHIGLTNGFLTEVQHELAIRYNDRSPLENLHCSKLFEILAQGPVNIFSGVTQEQFKDIRKNIIDVILHTDITQHPSMVKELELLYEMNSKVFEASTGVTLSEAEVEVLSTAENKKLILEMVLHGADISNPTKPWSIAYDWAYRVLDEYAAQGDQEKQLGIPVQVLNDREKVNRPNSQIGFIEFIIAPWVCAEVKVFPTLSAASQTLEANLYCWERTWIEESNPAEAEREKVKERVVKITNALRDRPPRVGAQGVSPTGKKRRSGTA